MSKIKSAARAAQTTGVVTDDTKSPAYLDRGSNAQVQRPEHQATFVAQLPTNLGNAATGTQIATAVNANAAGINSILTALINAGLMKAV